MYKINHIYSSIYNIYAAQLHGGHAAPRHPVAAAGARGYPRGQLSRRPLRADSR